MALLVVKFGGTSVGSVERIQAAAKKVKTEVENGHKVAVVVSAMAGETNKLVGLVDQMSDMYDAREYDTIVSSGEQVTAGLMALALQSMGVDARSWLGWQLPLLTDDMHGKARIEKIDTTILHERLALNQVAVVAGFQGRGSDNRITTLGRGGSDTSAVALAAALGADRCDIYTDVDGIYTTDPRVVDNARKIPRITYEEMFEMASLGAKVLQTRSVEMAMKHRVPVQVLSSFEPAVGSDLPGTMMMDEDDMMEQTVVSGIAHSRDEAKITLTRISDQPGVSAEIFGPLAENAINVDMIVQAASKDGETTDMTFTLTRTDLPKALEVLSARRDKINYQELQSSENVAKISVIGVGMRSHVGVAQKMFTTLAEKGINIHVISTSEIKISVLIDKEYAELAIRALHACYGLENGAS